MGKNMARLNGDTVINIEWWSDETPEEENLKDIGDRPVSMGDFFINGKFYNQNSREEIQTYTRILENEMDDLYNALLILGFTKEDVYETKTWTDLALEVKPYLQKAIQSLSDEDSLHIVNFYPQWEENKFYEANFKLQYQGILYKVLTSHTSQSSWTPNITGSLFAKILIPDENIIPDWEQPSSTNPYMIGDKVKHNGKIWLSTVNNNTWEPGVIGTESMWQELN